MKPTQRWMSLVLIATLLVSLGIPAAATQKSIRSGSQLSLTPGSADTLAAGGLKLNGHGHEFDEAYLVNKTGGSVVDGDVLTNDTATDDGLVAGDTVGSTRKFYVVVDSSIASNASGKTARSGNVTAKAQGAIARGQWVQKSATAKAVEDASVAITSPPPAGTVGFSRSAATGGFVPMFLLPNTVATAGGPIAVQSVTTTGTYTPTSGTSSVVLECWGGGGGGGGSNNVNAAGGGGGGGGYARKRVAVATASGATVTIGAAGAAGTSTGGGGAGGTTSFGAIISATGGSGGGAGAGGGTFGDGGAGGAGSSGDVNLTGATGGQGTGYSDTSGAGGYGGGAALFGVGGPAHKGSAGSAPPANTGGGGGGGGGTTGANTGGGAGATGRCIVTEY